MADLMSSLATSLGDTATSILTGFGNILPTALPIMGAVVAVTLGIKLFKRISK